MGLGHVPAGAIRQERQSDDVPRREHRGAGADLGSLTRTRVGEIGEAIAAGFLQRRGAAITERNLRVGRGEVDLIANIDGVRAAIEVKTVIASSSGDPIFKFDRAKHRQVRSLAGQLRIGRVDFVGVELEPGWVTVHWVPQV